MNRTNLISRKDFDAYSIKLPLQMLMKNRRNKFIYSELEKLHPCFSDEFCVKSKLKLSGKGVKSDVVVMKKLVLADYKNRFSGKKLWLEDLNKSYDDYGKNKVFVYLIYALFLAGVSAFLLFEFLDGKRNHPLKENLTTQLVTEIVPFYEEKFTKSFFDLVSLKNGSIKSFSWNQNMNGQEITASVGEMYPEDFDSLDSSKDVLQISYFNGKPELLVQIGAPAKIPVEESFRCGGIPLIRFCLRENHFEILKEEPGKESISFKFKASELKKVLLKLYEVMEVNNLAFRNFRMFPEGEDFMVIDLQLGGISSSDSLDLLSDIGNNCNHFGKKTPSGAAKSKMPLGIVEMDKAVEGEPYKKLGEIRRKNGEVIVFYKNEAGKVLKEVMNEGK